MKTKLIFPFLVLFVLFSCQNKKPTLVKTDDGKDYVVSNWDGGLFAYVIYEWNFGKFDDAVDIVKTFNQMAKDRGVGDEPIAMFPKDMRNWELGMIVKDDFEQTKLNDYPINRKEIPSGQYATMKLKGYPDYMFNYYNSFKKMLEKDGYMVLSDVYEIYTYDTFNNYSIADADKIGEIRYQVIKK